MTEIISPAFDPKSIATLDGVLIGDFEATADTLTFCFARLDGAHFALNLHHILRALVFSSQSGAMPPLPINWVSEVAAIHGQVFQNDA